MATRRIGICSPNPDYIVRASQCLADAPLRVVSATDAQEARALALEGPGCDVIVIDRGLLPGKPELALLEAIQRRRPDTIVVMRADRPETAWVVAAMRAGAVDVLDRSVDQSPLPDAVQGWLRSYQKDADDVVAKDPASQEVLQLARRLADSSATVMIGGESGSGKEVYARYIHAHSQRAKGPFVAINCAAIPENMLEAILFGYEKGAFTGATEARAGKFEQANGGTLLLDEITEMPLALQAKLLRVLQEREAERIGGKQAVALDVRVLATSNRDLKRAVHAGQFREDLFYRLNVLPLHLPPLRERKADVSALAEVFVERYAERPVRLSQRALDKMHGHDWPGNVRELENVIQRALILAPGEFVRADDIRFESMAATGGVETAGEPEKAALGDAIQDQEARLILEALREENGKRKQAAERLGISPRTLRYKLARIREAGHSVP
jgi:two-component system response regulator FlrC